MNSVKVQPLSRYKNEVGKKTKQHSLLETADNSWCHFELLRQNWMLDLGKVQMWRDWKQNKKKNTIYYKTKSKNDVQQW